jgi:hypothetical protein
LETNASAFCKNIKQGSKHWNEYRMKNIGEDREVLFQGANVG